MRMSIYLALTHGQSPPLYGRQEVERQMLEWWKEPATKDFLVGMVIGLFLGVGLCFMIGATA